MWWINADGEFGRLGYDPAYLALIIKSVRLLIPSPCQGEGEGEGSETFFAPHPDLLPGGAKGP